MKKQDITTRHDIYFLVKEFYKKVNKNEHISVFFKHIKDWDAHIETITTFWESSLFLQTKYCPRDGCRNAFATRREFCFERKNVP